MVMVIPAGTSVVLMAFRKLFFVPKTSEDSLSLQNRCSQRVEVVKVMGFLSRAWDLLKSSGRVVVDFVKKAEPLSVFREPVVQVVKDRSADTVDKICFVGAIGSAIVPGLSVVFLGAVTAEMVIVCSAIAFSFALFDALYHLLHSEKLGNGRNFGEYNGFAST